MLHYKSFNEINNEIRSIRMKLMRMKIEEDVIPIDKLAELAKIRALISRLEKEVEEIYEVITNFKDIREKGAKGRIKTAMKNIKKLRKLYIKKCFGKGKVL